MYSSSLAAGTKCSTDTTERERLFVLVHGLKVSSVTTWLHARGGERTRYREASVYGRRKEEQSKGRGVG